MTDYMKPKKLRIQVMIGEDRYQQLQTLAELTNSSISRIVRLTLDSQSNELNQAIAKASTNTNQADLYRSNAEPEPAPKKAQTGIKDKRRSTQKVMTDDAFVKLIEKQNKR